MSASDQCAQERQSLLSKLLDSVKQCQIRFGGKTELATESDSRVVCLCTQFEAVLQYGIRKNSKGFLRLRHVTDMMKGLNLLSPETDAVFWQFVRTVLNKHEYERYMLLKNIHTDIGRGRAWLRSALNERSLERYIHMMLADVNQISQFYEDWAFLMDQERSSMLPMMAAGLGSILFAISIDNPDLNVIRFSVPETSVVPKNSPEIQEFEPQPVIGNRASNIQEHNVKKKKKQKRPATQVISFDDDDLYDSESQGPHPEYFSAPASCLSSPVQLSGNFTEFSSQQISTNETNSHEFSDANDSCKVVSIVKTNFSKTVDSVTDISSYSTSSFVNENANNIDESNSKNIPQISLNARNCTSSKYSRVHNISEDIVENSSENTVEKFFSSIECISPSSYSTCIDTVEQRSPDVTTLTPIDNSSVGVLIPVDQNEDCSISANSGTHSAEDSVSIPSYCDDVENAVEALAIAQRVPSWSVSSCGSQGNKNGSQSKSRSDTLTMNQEELREAILSVLQKKEEVESKNKALHSLLEHEMEMSSGLRAEIEELEKHHQEKVERLESKIQTVARENELLKHQLKKYIAAVQMLKHDSSRVNELNTVIGEIQPAIPEPKAYIDHQFEANEYEKKLVQVAEMHGELMEFNERLHRLLLQREAVIRRLREELIDLRGPLPDDNQTSDDDVSITSDYDASSQTASSRPLINVWIPSAFLTGRTGDTHHVYQVYVRIRDDEWNIYRRYAQFYALHKKLKKKDPIVNTFDFPPKKTIGKKDAKVVEQRRRRLQHYLRCVLNWLLQTNSELANGPDKETFVSLLPFFGDHINVRGTRGNRQRTTDSRLSPENQQLVQRTHYTGI